MSTSAKNWLIAAAALVAIGTILFAAVMTVYQWDFTRLSTNHFETNTYEISETFDNIEFDTQTADILFVAADDDTCKVVCYEDLNRKHSVRVQNGTLTVSAADDGKWYEHIGIGFRSPEVTVYLPKAEYASIVVGESTGDIKIGKITVGTLELSVSTGDITVSDVTCKGEIKITITTGEADIENTTCQNLISTGSTGDITLKNVNVVENISIERSTGDVEFDDSDAAEIFVKTSTGDVTGSLLTEKIFAAKTSTGDVNVPKTTTGGTCEIITSTGDIEIKID